MNTNYKYNLNDRDKDWYYHVPGVVDFFSEISDIFHVFAKKHNLYIERYYHDAPLWMFLFNHPNGGTGQVVAYIKEKNCISISSSWFVDDNENNNRSIKSDKAIWAKVVDPKNHQEYLFQTLEINIEKVLGWEVCE